MVGITSHHLQIYLEVPLVLLPFYVRVPQASALAQTASLNPIRGQNIRMYQEIMLVTKTNEVGRPRDLESTHLLSWKQSGLHASLSLEGPQYCEIAGIFQWDLFF